MKHKAWPPILRLANRVKLLLGPPDANTPLLG